MDLRIPVNVSTPHPCLWIEADAQAIGEIFGNMADEDQVKVLTAMMTALFSADNGVQRDYAAILLAKPEHAEVRERLAYLTAEIV